MLAALHCGLRGNRVDMVRCRNHDTINVLLLVEHLAEIGITRGFVEFLLERDSFRPVLLTVLQLLGDLALGITKVDIGKGDEILRLCQLESVL